MTDAAPPIDFQREYYRMVNEIALKWARNGGFDTSEHAGAPFLAPTYMKQWRTDVERMRDFYVLVGRGRYALKEEAKARTEMFKTTTGEECERAHVRYWREAALLCTWYQKLSKWVTDNLEFLEAARLVTDVDELIGTEPA